MTTKRNAAGGSGAGYKHSKLDASNSTPAAEKHKLCSRCNASAASHYRVTLGGTRFRVCTPCDAQLNVAPIAQVIAFCDGVDRKAGA